MSALRDQVAIIIATVANRAWGQEGQWGKPVSTDYAVADTILALPEIRAALELEGMDSARLDWLESHTRIWPADEQQPISVGISEHVWPRASLRQAIDAARAGGK